MSNSLHFLRKTKPFWCKQHKQHKQHKAKLEIFVEIATDNGLELFDLKIFLDRGGSVHVQEAGKCRLPSCCPDRHINPNGTFCISYESTNPIQNDNQAHLWWKALHRYLKNQLVADEVRKWPLTEGLSHGNAAVKSQMQIERLLSHRPLLLTEALRGMFRRTGWLGATLPRFSRKGQLYGRPRVCPRNQCLRCRQAELERLTTGAKPELCPDLKLVRQVTFLEIDRRRQERVFIKTLRKRHKCCGTMKNCSLRDIESWY